MALMFAQLIEAQLSRRLEAMLGALRNELLPALRAEPGFCGAVCLTDLARARVLLVLLWETEDQAGRPITAGTAPFAHAPSTVAELLASGSCSATIWEVDARS